MTQFNKRLVVFLVSCAVIPTAKAELSKEQLYTLYNQANESFRTANATKDPEQSKREYEKAILNFEKIIQEGSVENAGLYYNLANAYFLQDQLGKAILNYRKALQLDDSDENIQKNLAFARSKRIDKIPVQTEKRVMQTLFFWHYDFSLKTKFLLTCIFFAMICISVTAILWVGKNAVCTSLIGICSVLTLCFLVSVSIEYKLRISRICGVITVKETVVRQGDGDNYAPSFKEPLHEGTEFVVVENRSNWIHIRLSDGSDGWIPQNAVELIAPD
jgi:hypothetical protein